MGHVNIVLLLLHSHKVTYHRRNAREQGRLTGARTAVRPRQIKNLISEVDKRGFSPIFYACSGSQPRIVEILIQHGADISSAVEQCSPIDLAAKGFSYGNQDAVYRSFMMLSEHRHIVQLEVVRILVEGGVVLSQTPLRSLNVTVWISAIETPHGTELLELLLRAKGNEPPPAFRGVGTLIHAVARLYIGLCQNGRDVRMVQMLIRRGGVDPFQRNSRGETAMHDAANGHKVELFRYLFFLLVQKEGYRNDILDEFEDSAEGQEMWEEMKKIDEECRTMRNEAVVMGQHARIGEDSWLRALDPELLRIVVGDSMRH
jgi:hypothetical protein